MSKYEVWSICSSNDKTFTSEKKAVQYAECLGDWLEAIWEVTEDGERIQRDDLI